MTIPSGKEYRLVHKKNGEYILQVKEYVRVINYDKNEVTLKEFWQDLETIEK